MMKFFTNENMIEIIKDLEFKDIQTYFDFKM